MRYIVLTLLSFWLLAGCGSEPTTQETSTGPMAAKMIEEPATAAASQGISPVIEYVWHRAGENFSRDALMENIAFWNSLRPEWSVCSEQERPLIVGLGHCEGGKGVFLPPSDWGPRPMMSMLIIA